MGPFGAFQPKPVAPAPSTVDPNWWQQFSGAAAPTTAPGGDPWASLQQTYGLGAPAAPGMPASLPGVQLGAPPQLSGDDSRFTDFMNQINGQIGQAYDYETPQTQASLIGAGDVPQAQASQMGTSPELARMLSGEGYSPDTLTKMRASAYEQPAQAGRTQLTNVLRSLNDSGLGGSGAEAAMRGDVGRETGYAQGQALRDVDVANAQAGMENMRFGVGQQSNIGLSNMQQANQMALANSSQLFDALRANQAASNSANQMNTGLQAQQGAAGAAAQSGFLGQQGAQGQSQAQEKEVTNNQNAWEGQQQQAGFDWQKQLQPWEELNKRYGQAQGIMGAWGA